MRPPPRRFSRSSWPSPRPPALTSQGQTRLLQRARRLSVGAAARRDCAQHAAGHRRGEGGRSGGLCPSAASCATPSLVSWPDPTAERRIVHRLFDAFFSPHAPAARRFLGASSRSRFPSGGDRGSARAVRGARGPDTRTRDLRVLVGGGASSTGCWPPAGVQALVARIESPLQVGFYLHRVLDEAGMPARAARCGWPRSALLEAFGRTAGASWPSFWRVSSNGRSAACAIASRSSSIARGASASGALLSSPFASLDETRRPRGEPGGPPLCRAPCGARRACASGTQGAAASTHTRPCAAAWPRSASLSGPCDATTGGTSPSWCSSAT